MNGFRSDYTQLEWLQMGVFLIGLPIAAVLVECLECWVSGGKRGGWLSLKGIPRLHFGLGVESVAIGSA